MRGKFFKLRSNLLTSSRCSCIFVVKIFLPPLCTDVGDSNSIQQCLYSREQPLHWMCPQLPPFLLGSKFSKRCEWGGRDRSLKPGSVCGKVSSPKRRMGLLSWAVPSRMVVTLAVSPPQQGKEGDRPGPKGPGAARESDSAPGVTLWYC